MALLDQAAVIACMTYVDLNPIRAKQAETPEASAFTSVQDRIGARQAHRIATGIAQREAATRSIGNETRSGIATIGPEDGLWIAPVARCTPASDTSRSLAPFPLSLDSYLQLVDETGRIVRSGKRGAIPADLAPILARLEIDAEAWIDAMTRGGSFLGAAIGSAAARATEAARRGAKWIIDRLGLHPKRPATY